ncbi:FecR family protein [Chitinophaga arvensicola]|uniref:Ferric-dicitrate binding protein FerR, regulates iron transport through sigma-19 n=1 Tax=Chitinophaga arvensicola TaxID=29529 RepID=A0A1I0QWY8_9BACT|nr:FecR family protein [Chitinophaga arvensicola]SEW32283.1 ferric-dicitrate binding protein FerR, regulates iron transport through sigma-19 [Chitinophaga arvensicola]
MATQRYPRAEALLRKFHAGKCTQEELALLDNWYDGLNNDATLSAIESHLLKQQFLTNFRSTLPAAPVAWWKRRSLQWSVAASLLLLAGAVWMWNNQTTPPNTRIAELKSFVVTNETSNIKLVVLPDSSRIWLNTAASLRWKEDFNRQRRNVQLTGEGFFEVQGNKDKPFVIHTRDLAIQVLGTKFNVEAYAGEGLTRVSLVQGKVKVNAKKDSTILKPGFAASFNNGDKGLNIAATEAGKVAAWKEGAFSATDLPFKDAVMRLCTHNGYQVKWENTQGIDKNISVLFKKDSFTKMLANLCYISRKQFRISDRQVTIY